MNDLIRDYQDISGRLYGLQGRHQSIRALIKDIKDEVDQVITGLVQLRTFVGRYIPLGENLTSKENVETLKRSFDDLFCSCKATLAALSSQIESLNSSGSAGWTYFIQFLYYGYTISRHSTPLRRHRKAIDTLIQVLERYIFFVLKGWRSFNSIVLH